MKKYIIIAGVNGAGKSTLYHMIDHLHNMPRVNLDDEVRKIGNWKNSQDVFYAGITAASMLKRLLAGEEDFNQETTLCGRTILANIKKAKQNGFYIEVHFVGLSSVELAKERVQHRVTKGGHGIPETDIERRYDEGFEKIRSLLPIADRVIFYDNSTEIRRFAVYEKGSISVESSNLPKWYLEHIR